MLFTQQNVIPRGLPRKAVGEVQLKSLWSRRRPKISPQTLLKVGIFHVTDQQRRKLRISKLGALLFFLIAAPPGYPAFHRKQAQALRPCFTRPETSSDPGREGRREPPSRTALAVAECLSWFMDEIPALPWAPRMFCSRAMFGKIWEFGKSWAFCCSYGNWG